MSEASLLIVDRDPQTAACLAGRLSLDGFDVALARSADHAAAIAARDAYDLILLGELDGAAGQVALLRSIRGAVDPYTGAEGVLVRADAALPALTALEAGADDFVDLKVEYAELRARLAALARRRRAPASTLAAGPVSVDLSARVVRVNGADVHLRRLEFELLALLASEPERVFTRAEITRAVWGGSSRGSGRTIDSHASRLRRRLAGAGAAGLVVCVRGVGFRLR